MLVVCLGDSITFGYPYGPEASWVSLAQQTVGVELINKGVNGDTTGDMLMRFTTDVLSYKPTDVIVLGGTNDAWAETPLKTVEKNIVSMVALAKKAKIRFHLGLPIPVNLHAKGNSYFKQAEKTAPYLNDYRNWMGAYGRKYKINIIDFYTPMLQADGTAKAAYYVDTGHPSSQGYHIMATTLIGYWQNSNLA